jgi:hypothetical protein
MIVVEAWIIGKGGRGFLPANQLKIYIINARSSSVRMLVYIHFMWDLCRDWSEMTRLIMPGEVVLCPNGDLLVLVLQTYI